jgi:hypothetical protein
MRIEIVQQFFIKRSPISNLIKTGLSVLKLFHAYRQMDGEILTQSAEMHKQIKDDILFFNLVFNGYREV